MKFKQKQPVVQTAINNALSGDCCSDRLME